MNLVFASGLASMAARWDRHSVPVFVASLLGLAVIDRFLAGRRDRAAADPVNNDYADPPNEFE